MELTPSELVQPLIEHINRVIAERNKLRTENASLQNTIAELRKENEQSFRRILQLTAQVSDAHEEIHTLEADLSRLSDELKLLRGQGKLTR